MGKVLKFPEAEALRAQARPRGSALLFRLGKRLGLPGPTTRVETSEIETGRKIVVQVGPVFTRLSLDGNDVFYDRNGKAHAEGSTVHYLAANAGKHEAHPRSLGTEQSGWILDEVSKTGIRKFVLKSVRAAPLYLTWAL